LAIAKVGRRGNLVIPSGERRKARIEEGDRVEVEAGGEGLLFVKKIPNLKEIRRKMAGRLPQWAELEGRADILAEKEVKK